jgi:hypothetical protein
MKLLYMQTSNTQDVPTVLYIVYRRHDQLCRSTAPLFRNDVTGYIVHRDTVPICWYKGNVTS